MVRLANHRETLAEVPVALLAGGLATRLRPITQTIPKAMVEVAGRPFIDHQLTLLQTKGIRRVVLCLGHLGEQIEAHVGDGRKLGLNVSYSYDGARLVGTGGALRRAVSLLGDLCWVLYGDSYLNIDYRAILDAFHGSGAEAMMTVYQNGNRWDRSNVIFHEGRLICYDKRRPAPEMTHIDYGASLLRTSLLHEIPADEPYDLAELFHRLVAEGKMVGHEIYERFYEIGSPSGLAEAQVYLGRRARTG